MVHGQTRVIEAALMQALHQRVAPRQRQNRRVQLNQIHALDRWPTQDLAQGQTIPGTQQQHADRRPVSGHGGVNQSLVVAVFVQA